MTRTPEASEDDWTDYDRYIRTPELLRLQKPREARAHPDELIFQVEHQAMELWFKVILEDLAEAQRFIEADRPLEAERLLGRGARILGLLSEQLLVLDTLAPWDYHTIRLQLGRGSGGESPGFRQLLVTPPKLWAPFIGLLAKRNTNLEDVYANHREHYDAFRLAEAMTDFDMRFQMWRTKHLTFIKRVIGRDVKSLKGYSVHELEKAVEMQLFPELWAVRNALTDRAGTSPDDDEASAGCPYSGKT